MYIRFWRNDEYGRMLNLGKKVGIVSLGCPKNQVDSEIMLGKLTEENYKIVNDENEAEIIIVNTCGFIESAKQESINTILEMAKHKQDKCEMLIVAGCLAQRYSDDILKEIPEVDAIVGTGGYSSVTEAIEEAYKGSKPKVMGNLCDVSYMENQRVITTGSSYAYLKIAEGCDNFCTYCIIPALRGRYRSRKLEDILREARTLAESGTKEVILIAQDTTRYGTDIYGERKLAELLREIAKINGIEWIRVLYCYPEEIDEDLLKEFAENKKVCNYLDIPIQHSSDKVLKAMGRRGTQQDIERVLSLIRKRVPEITIRTTLIVGFPGEDEQDYANLKAFVRDFEFDRLGVFMYSKEEGTPAGKMKNQIPKKVKQARYDQLMEIQQEIAYRKNQDRMNKTYRVLTEGVADDGIFYYGRSCYESPDIDGVIYFTAQEPLNIGEFVNVRILASEQYDLTGEVEYEA